MPPRVAARVAVWLLIATSVAAGCGSSPTPSATTSASSSAPTATPTSTASASASASPSPTATSADLSTHPFTVLVMGGDNGFRTDAMIVVGVDPVARTLAFASIPRDTIDVPLPGGGTLSNQKINAFYDIAAGLPGQYPQGPGRATADMVGLLLGIHIDYFAATSFGGFTNLAQAMGGVTVNLPAAVVDPYYQYAPGKAGVVFPKGTQHLSPPRSLIFVRTRQGDNDFQRERRQQLFLIAAGRELVAKPVLLGALMLAAAQGSLKTDFPLLQLPTLMSTVGSVPSSGIRQIVLGPSVYESLGSCTCGYALEPDVAAMRRLARLFYPWAVTP